MAPLAECPVCHQPLRWTYILRTVWSQWHCAACGSLLGIDRKRRVLGLFPFVGLVLGLSLLMPPAGLGTFVFVPAVVGLAIPYFLLVDRAVVLERYGFRCRACGYNLQGQTVPRCPECGRRFDADERARLEAGSFTDVRVAERRRRRAAFALLIIVPLLISVGFGIAFWQLSSAKLARQPGTASQPTSSTAMANR
jgi:hypothetical protein